MITGQIWKLIFIPSKTLIKQFDYFQFSWISQSWLWNNRIGCFSIVLAYFLDFVLRIYQIWQFVYFTLYRSHCFKSILLKLVFLRSRNFCQPFASCVILDAFILFSMTIKRKYEKWWKVLRAAVWPSLFTMSLSSHSLLIVQNWIVSIISGLIFNDRFDVPVVNHWAVKPYRWRQHTIRKTLNLMLTWKSVACR